MLVAVSLMFGACDLLSTTADEGATVGIGFQAVSSGSESGKRAGRSAAVQDEIVVNGNNGTLTLTNIRFIVAELELEGDDDACDDDGDDCHEFEASAAFVDLPLETGNASPVVTGDVPPGRYTELEFDVEDLDLDDTDESEEDDDGQEYQDLATEIRAGFPDWPDEASMVVTGEFTPADGSDPRPFTAFFDAEIEVELVLSPALEITEQGASRDLTVKLSPARWFARTDGTVMDLSSSDYSNDGELVEFELELEEGFSDTEVEIEID
jgi:hypothetical protein